MSRLVQLSLFAVVLAIALTLVWWPGCRQFPAVTSPEALKLIKVVHTAANTRDPALLEAAGKRFDALVQSNQISPREKESFERILELAKQGQWASAEELAFRFAQDQIGQGKANP